MNMRMYFYALLLLFAMLSCGTDNNRTEYDTIKEYIAKRLGDSSINGINRVFILTENGCIGCNKTFAKLAALERNFPQTLIIVKRLGAIIDPAPFEGDSIRNAIFDNKDLETESDTLFMESRFIVLGKDRIDTMLTINAQTLYQDIEYIMRPLQRSH